jgi:hypothetical protein
MGRDRARLTLLTARGQQALRRRRFRAVLVSEGAGWLRRKLMYAAVVIGGGPAYRSDQARGPRIFNRDESTSTPT